MLVQKLTTKTNEGEQKKGESVGQFRAQSPPHTGMAISFQEYEVPTSAFKVGGF